MLETREMDDFDPPKMTRFDATIVLEKFKQWRDKAWQSWDSFKFADHLKFMQQFDLGDKLKSADKFKLLDKFNFHSNKTLLILILVVILIVVGGLVKYMHYENALMEKAATRVIEQASAMLNIQQELGLPLALQGDVDGSVSNKGNDAQIEFSVAGSKAQGRIDATLTEGKLTALVLATPDGKSFDVLKKEAVLEKTVALQKAEQAKKTQLDHTFKAAIQAYNDKDYKEALNGFEQSIKNEYEVPTSYE
jgi:hypothetical protein